MFRDVCSNDKDKMMKKSKEFITIKIRRVVTLRQGSPEVITKDKEVERYFWGLLGNVLLFGLFRGIYMGVCFIVIWLI